MPTATSLPTLAGRLAEGTGFDLLQTALDAAGLTAALGVPEARLTLLAPTDAAFLKLARGFGFTGTDETEAFQAIAAGLATRSPGDDPIPLLQDILGYHVLGGAATRQQLDREGSATTLSGETLGFQGRFILDAEPDGNAAFILPQTNIPALNGQLQTIDTVLLPFDFTPTILGQLVVESVGPGGAAFDADRTDHDVLLAALDAAGLAGALADPDSDLTLFAPTDAAFIRLARDLGGSPADEAEAFQTIVDALTTLGGGDPVPLLTDVLLYHVAPGAQTVAGLEDAGSVQTLAGTGIEVFDTRFGTFLGDQDPSAVNPRIIGFRADELAENGIIQAIDRVLLPADLI